MIHKFSVRTDLLFLLFAALWGASYPITQHAISNVNPYFFVFLRFVVATFVLIPFILNESKKNFLSWIKIGMVLGLMNTGIYTFETLSLKYTTVSRSAFILGANVVLVPFLSHLIKVSKVTIIEILSAVLFVVGLYILTGSHFNNINLGDVLALLGALTISLSITYLSYISTKDFHPILLTFYQLIFTCPIPYLIFAGTGGEIPAYTTSLLFAVLFCGIFATAIPLLGQIKYQQYTTAAQTASIFALEPVFAILVAYSFYGEPVTKEVVIGGTIMLCSTLIPVYLKHIKAKRILHNY